MGITCNDAYFAMTEIKDQMGFVDFQTKNQEIVKETDIVIHMINVNQIEDIINQMTDNISLMKIRNKDILQRELLDTRNKLLTLLPRNSRHKRGLINAIGSMTNWLFGTMDDNDRQDIQNHLLKTDANLSQQIQVNKYFNTALEQLKQFVKSDRKIIENTINSINKFNEKEVEQNLYLEQLSKIQLIRDKIEHIQDNIVSAKYGIIHPNILTSEEIIKY